MYGANYQKPFNVCPEQGLNEYSTYIAKHADLPPTMKQQILDQYQPSLQSIVLEQQ